jgi:hypothetical protein
MTGSLIFNTMTRTLNETLAKWRGGEGPLWVRDHGFKRVVEVEQDGNIKALTVFDGAVVHRLIRRKQRSV